MPDEITPGQVWMLEDFGEVLILSLRRQIESYNPEEDVSVESERVQVQYTTAWDDVGAAMDDVILAYASSVWDNGVYVKDANIWNPENGAPPEDLDIGGDIKNGEDEE